MFFTKSINRWFCPRGVKLTSSGLWCQVNFLDNQLSPKFQVQAKPDEVAPWKFTFLFWKEQQQLAPQLYEHRAEGKNGLENFTDILFFTTTGLWDGRKKMWTKDRNAGFQSCVLVFFKQVAWMICYSAEEIRYKFLLFVKFHTSSQLKHRQTMT